jgi:LmbE family N-acetylglucosaminyl deacetylase
MRVLVFSAHPDDAEFALGGTLLRLAHRHEITIVVATDGGAGSYGSKDIRHSEQEAACKFLGANLVWLGEPDCSIDYTRSRALEYAAIIREHQPELVLVTHPDQTGGVHDGLAHPDHKHIGLCVRDAVRFARFRIEGVPGERHDTRHLWYYMVPRSRVPKLLVPVDSVEKALVELWSLHASQHQLRNGGITEHLLQARKMAASDYDDFKLAEAIDSDAPIPTDFVCRLLKD